MKISTLASLVLLAAPLTAMADEQIPATAFTDWEYSTNHGPENVVDGDIDTYFETLKGQYMGRPRFGRTACDFVYQNC